MDGTEWASELVRAFSEVRPELNSDEYRKFVEEIAARRETLDSVFIRTEQTRTSTADRCVFYLGAGSYEDFKEIVILLTAGKECGAIKIVRALFEKVVTATYLSKNPAKAEDFLKYDDINKHKLLYHMSEEIKSRLVDPQVVATTTFRYRQSKPRFTRQRGKREQVMLTWTEKHMPELAAECDDVLASTYGAAFTLPTYYVHASATDVLGRYAASGSLSSEGQPSCGDFLATAYQSHLLLYMMAKTQIAHFSLPIDAGVLVDAVNECWRPKNSSD